MRENNTQKSGKTIDNNSRLIPSVNKTKKSLNSMKPNFTAKNKCECLHLSIY